MESNQTSRRCCFLSTDDLGISVCDDDLTVAELQRSGWSVETVSWHAKDIEWKHFDMVVVRSTWDYHHHPREFLDVLKAIDASGTRLENSLETIRWNLNKTYLRDLHQRGIAIVPTLFVDDEPSNSEFAQWQRELGSEDLIIKPTISATASDTFRLTAFEPFLADTFRNRPFLVQPLMQHIEREGEFSLFYFNGVYSHAIIKRPRPGDFRVQDEFGGTNTLIQPDENLLAFGQGVMQVLDDQPLYARTDFVRVDDNRFALMELELIEPSLYFALEPAAVRRFVSALAARLH